MNALTGNEHWYKLLKFLMISAIIATSVTMPSKIIISIEELLADNILYMLHIFCC